MIKSTATRKKLSLGLGFLSLISRSLLFSIALTGTVNACRQISSDEQSGSLSMNVNGDNHEKVSAEETRPQKEEEATLEEILNLTVSEAAKHLLTAFEANGLGTKVRVDGKEVDLLSELNKIVNDKTKSRVTLREIMAASGGDVKSLNVLTSWKKYRRPQTFGNGKSGARILNDYTDLVRAQAARDQAWAMKKLANAARAEADLKVQEVQKQENEQCLKKYANVCIKAYLDRNFEGGQPFLLICRECSRLGDKSRWNDKIKSFELPEGRKVKICIHSEFDVKSKDPAQNKCKISGTTDYVGDEFADKISYFEYVE
jgi:hypothetical protein